jgi:hypothetical protein
VSAPDGIQPLFHGDDLRHLRRALRAKMAFTHDTKGLYVGTVHGGVLDARDAARRGAHLAFVSRQLARPDLWLATLGDVARWWAARERLHLQVDAERVIVTNAGRAPVAGARVLVERRGESITMLVPLLHPGECVGLALPSRPRPSEDDRVQEAS